MEPILQTTFGKVLQGIREMASGHIHMEIKTLGFDLASDLHRFITQSLFTLEYKSIVYVNTPKDILVSEYILICRTALVSGEIILEKKYKSKGIKALVCAHSEQKQLKHNCMFNSFIRFNEIIRISTEGMEKNFIQIVTVNGKFIKRKSLAQIKALLPTSFIQIEKRDIINLDFLKGMNENASIVFMEGIRGIEVLDQILVGKTYRNQLKEKLDNELFV